MTNVNIGQLIAQIAAIITQIIGYALLLLIAGAIIQRYGVKIPYVPAIDHITLAYLAGAWWLYRK